MYKVTQGLKGKSFVLTILHDDPLQKYGIKDTVGRNDRFFFFRTISCEKRDVIALYLMLYLRVYVKAMVCFNLNK